MWLEYLFQDLWFSWRILRKEKNFCALTVLVLGLGIGGVITMFSVINGVLLRGLPFPHPEQLVDVKWRDPGRPPDVATNLLPADYLELRPAQRSFTDLAAYLHFSTVNLTIQGAPQRIQGAYVTENFFALLGIKPVLGRDFTPADNLLEAPRVAVISHLVWQRDFGGDRAVIGQGVRINGRAATIIGVMAPGFAFPTQEQIWLPLFNTFPSQARNFQVAIGAGAVAASSVKILARLKPGVTLLEARQEWNNLAAGLSGKYPETNKLFTEAAVVPLIHAFVDRNQRMMLYVMSGAVVGVLLIACVNVMNMQFARATRRYRELVIRLAVGAPRGRLVAQMLVENALLASLGGMAGILLAYGSMDLFRRALALQQPSPPFWIHFEIDARALIFTAGVAMVATLASGLLPALIASRVSASGALNDATRGNTSGTVRTTMRGLVVAQIGLTCALLVLSALVIRSVINQQRIDYGYDAGGFLSARVGLIASDDYPTPAHRQQFYDRVLRELRRTPGIEAAAMTSRLRMTLGGSGSYEIEGAKYASERDRPQCSFENITGDYFASLGLTVREGRDFTEEDNDSRQPVALVSASFARKNFGGASALGRRVRPFTPAKPGPWRTIVGVVPDIVMQSPPFSAQIDRAGLFVPISINPPQFATILVRPGGGSPALAKNALRGAVARIDSNLPLYFVETPQQSHDELLAQNRILATLFSSFGLVAVVLAMVGVYGVLAFGVSQRTREFGVRMALGAGRKQIIAMILKDGGRGLALGIGVGLVCATALVHWFVVTYAGVLFEVSRFDPVAYGAVVALITTMAGLACLVPVLRATNIDPVRVLRAE